MPYKSSQYDIDRSKSEFLCWMKSLRVKRIAKTPKSKEGSTETMTWISLRLTQRKTDSNAIKEIKHLHNAPKNLNMLKIV